MTAAPLGGAPLGASPLRATSLLVVGSGVAGLYAALTAAARGLEVTLLTKDNLENSNSWFAQGGLSAVGPSGISRGDSVASHVADTLTAGARLNDADAVAAMCGAAWEHVERLTAAGAVFDSDPDGGCALGLEAAHAHARILHAGGDATGKALSEALIDACLKQEAAGALRIRERAFATELLATELLAGDAAEPRRITGVRVLNADGTTEDLTADAVLLATGGIGNLFAATTNPHGATGDGAALAYRAGALLVDSEFVQFHPTLVSPGGFMVSEAVRGEGAVLVDQRGHRFMPAVHPDAELAPRDVVARAIHAVNTAGGQAYLDATGVEAARGTGFLARRFPSITAALARLGHDLAAAPVPVSEAAHYWMGGVFTDRLGRTTLPGLYAAGEAACTGVHGANRLASNSLLEALVFAWSAVVNLPSTGTSIGTSATADTGSADTGSADTGSADTGSADASAITTHTLQPELTAAAGTTPVDLPTLQRLATCNLGVERTGADLESALRQLSGWHVEGDGRAARELRNLLTLARVMATAALARENSIGAHFRLDAPWHPEPANGTLPRHGFRQGATSTANANTANAATSQLVSSNIGS